MTATKIPQTGLQLSRRNWLKAAPLATLSASAQSLSLALEPQPQHTGWLLSGADGEHGQPHLVALNRNKQQQYAWPLPGRAHDIGLLPTRQDISCLGFCIARRPGTWLYWFDLTQGKLLAQITSPQDSHFYGHAASNTDRSLLYVTENHYQTPKRPTPRGVIGIYQTTPPFARLGELDACGLGPHQILFDARKGQLIVANGGNITHPSTDRDVLNLDSMQPNLSYLHPTSGKLLEQREPTDPHMSLRHIALSETGVLAIGVQDQSPQRDPDAPAPLVLAHNPGQALTPLPASANQWLSAHQYIGSMATSPDGSFVLASAPRANQLLLWHNTGPLQVFTATDAAGITWNTELKGFLASNSGGQLFNLNLTPNAQLAPLPQLTPWHWDNHLFVG